MVVDSDDEGIEGMVIDFKDWFHVIPTAPEERGCVAAKALEETEVQTWTTSTFGCTSAFASGALRGRAGASMLALRKA